MTTSVSPNLTQSLEPGSLRDHFLIAMPGISDSVFTKTVIYICEHTEKGAMGIILNIPTSMPLGEVFAQMDLTDTGAACDRVVMASGPVQPERGFVLHTPDVSFSSTLHVSDEVCLTASRDIIEAIAEDLGPKAFFIGLGYSGWSEGQLEEEIAQNSWLTVPADKAIIFSTPPEQRWVSAARGLGIDIRLLTGVAGHA
jgi:putative transcriptional regulator